MLKNKKQLLVLLILAICSDLGFCQLNPVGVSKHSARLKYLHLDQDKAVFERTGGFRAYDVVEKKAITFDRGLVEKNDTDINFSCENEKLKINANFVLKNNRLEVTGKIENLKGNDRAIILDYWMPCTDEKTLFSFDLDSPITLRDSVDHEENVFPIAAMCRKDSAVAIAIPPSSPHIFGMVGNAENGMAVRFYLGLTPETKNFPNQASFAFEIFFVEAKWGFRSALEQYYDFHPDFYERRFEQGGLAMLAMYDEVPPNVTQYSYNRNLMGKTSLTNETARDEKYGILTFPSNIVGVREIRNLPESPEGYAEIMKVYSKHKAEAKDKKLYEEIDNSTCFNSEGELDLMVRNTFWGSTSMSFITNPNPYLYDDSDKKSVGKDNIEEMLDAIKKHPELDGMFLDSLGRVWPAVFNYRREHFAYAKYPLTIDNQGQVVLHNRISHYEFIEYLREIFKKQNRFIFANGVYAYNIPGRVAEHYRDKTKVGGFFMASMLDVASSEAGIKADNERCKDVRVFMAKKAYALINYHWDDAGKVNEFVNRSLCYGIFATNKDNPFTKTKYIGHPDGYERDKELIDWFIPLARKLHAAGWEPVTHCKIVEGKKVSLERFGSGAEVFFTLFSENPEVQTCKIQVDFKKMGFKREKININEIAQSIKPIVQAGNIELKLEPLKTYIIGVSN
jgi:hypothetical protein